MLQEVLGDGGGGTMRRGQSVQTSGGRAAGGQWRGFDLLINGGWLVLLQVVNFNY